MQTFVAERNLKGIAMDQLADAQKRAISTADKMSKAGTPVKYLRSTFVPETGECLCLFEGNSAADVEALNREANIPFTRVMPAMDLTPAA